MINVQPPLSVLNGTTLTVCMISEVGLLSFHSAFAELSFGFDLIDFKGDFALRLSF